MDEAENIIAQLELQPLPAEGGFYRQTWAGPPLPGSTRPAGTAILYLITAESFSALHRLETDEVWHFYAGDVVRLVQLDPATGRARTVRLGAELTGDDVLQHVVPAGTWQGARLADPGGRGWALLGCTLAPGWSDREFTLGARDELLRRFPGARVDIMGLTR